LRPHLDENHLLTRFCAGFRPRRERKVGLEYELLGVHREDGTALPYAAEAGGGQRVSVSEVLRALSDRFGWRVIGGEPPLELSRHGSRITLEPGAQIELSGRPHARLTDAEDELRGFLDELDAVSDPMGIDWLPMGLHPITVPDEITIIPKPRYRIMTEYLPTRGDLALWMMRTTAGAQINLDVESSAEAAAMLRLSLQVSSVITALFANSPLTAGEPNGWKSRRGRIWLEVDPDRCGIPRRCVEPDATVCDYAAWAMDAPMFFVEREDGLVDLSGHSFRTFMNDGAKGAEPRIEDWDLHLTTLFPEARLKTYLELRCMDSNRLELVMAFAALTAGLVYGGPQVHEQIEARFGGWAYDQRLAFLESCARDGLAARAPSGETARELAVFLVALAGRGIEPLDPDGRAYLAPIEEMARVGRVPADDVLEAWTGSWTTSRDALVALSRR
jgi:glutamate--cysteine ligase